MIGIVAHRGFWRRPEEKNSLEAFVRALDSGFGIETDVRDLAGRLVISHDPPRGGEMGLQDFLALCEKYPGGRPLALNIKADGLHKPLQQELRSAGTRDYYVFDMSIPDTLDYLRQGTPTFTRLSEYEPTPAFLDQAEGIWLDAFVSEWYGRDTIMGLLEKGKKVCVVSPELHGRPHEALWRLLRETGVSRSPLLQLCTDFPDRARELFS